MKQIKVDLDSTVRKKILLTRYMRLEIKHLIKSIEIRDQQDKQNQEKINDLEELVEKQRKQGIDLVLGIRKTEEQNHALRHMLISILQIDLSDYKF